MLYQWLLFLYLSQIWRGSETYGQIFADNVDKAFETGYLVLEKWVLIATICMLQLFLNTII